MAIKKAAAAAAADNEESTTAEILSMVDPSSETTELEAVEASTEETAEVPDAAVAAVEEPSEPATQVEPAAPVVPPVTKRSFFRRLVSAVFWLGLLGAAIAAMVFVVWPLFDREVLQSVESNAAETAAIEERLDVLEQASALRQESIESLTSAQATTASSLTAVESRLSADIAQIAVDLTEAMASAQVTDDTVASLMAQTTELAESGRVTATDTQIVTAMELMARARLSLFQANYGLAANDVRLADQVLGGIPDPDVSITIARARLDTVASNLPDRPVLAAGDLDIAWQILLDDVTGPFDPLAPAPAAVDEATAAEPATDDAIVPDDTAEATENG